MTDRRTGIVIGLVLGIAAVVLFVFVLSDDTVDAPSIDETATEQSRSGSGDNDAAGSGEAGEGAKADDKDATGSGPSGGSQAPPEPPIPTIDVVGGEPKAGVQTFETTKGQKIVFRVRADAPEHVHVHGYDLFEDVGPGVVAKFSFTADIDGIFEVELEDSAVQIAELRVNP